MINHFRKGVVVKTSVLLVLLLFLVIGLPLLSSCGAPTKSGWSGASASGGSVYVGSTSGKIVALSNTDGSRTWEAALNGALPSSGGFGCSSPPIVTSYGTPVVAGDNIYIGSYIRAGNSERGKIYAFRVGKTEPRWIYPRQDSLDNPIIGGAVVAQGNVYIGASDGTVYALNADEGFKEWTFRTGKMIWSTPAADDSTVYVSSFDAKLYALDAATGSKKWEFETGGAIATTPTVYKGTVYVGSFDRYIYAVDATSGNLKWKSATMSDGWFWARPVAYNDVVYAGSLDGKIYALNAATGEKVTDINIGSPLSSSPVQVDSSIIFASQDGRIWQINTASNEAKILTDLKEIVNASLSSSDSTIYVHTEKADNVYAVNAQSGAVLWKISLNS